jgi:hypothetical protein
VDFIAARAQRLDGVAADEAGRAGQQHDFVGGSHLPLFM